MTRKLFFVIPALCLGFLLTSCYPELSVQQYDKLKADLAEINQHNTVLQGELAASEAELEAMKASNREALTYVTFLTHLISTQNSERLLQGEFDYDSLTAKKASLLEEAKTLDNGDIEYFLTLINPEDEVQTIGAYYKVIEYTTKSIKQKLGVTATPSSVTNP